MQYVPHGHVEPSRLQGSRRPSGPLRGGGPWPVYNNIRAGNAFLAKKHADRKKLRQANAPAHGPASSGLNPIRREKASRGGKRIGQKLRRGEKVDSGITGGGQLRVVGEQTKAAPFSSLLTRGGFRGKMLSPVFNAWGKCGTQMLFVHTFTHSECIPSSFYPLEHRCWKVDWERPNGPIFCHSGRTSIK